MWNSFTLLPSNNAWESSVGWEMISKTSRWSVCEELGPCRVTTAPWLRVQTGMSRRSDG